MSFENPTMEELEKVGRGSEATTQGGESHKEADMHERSFRFDEPERQKRVDEIGEKAVREEERVMARKIELEQRD